MTAPNRPEPVSVADEFDPALLELLAAGFAEANCYCAGHVRAGRCKSHVADARTALAILRAQGRSVHPDADTRTEHGVRFTEPDRSAFVSPCRQAIAEERAAFYAKRRAVGPHQVVSAEVVQRTVITSVGPWVPVPTPKEN